MFHHFIPNTDGYFYADLREVVTRKLHRNKLVIFQAIRNSTQYSIVYPSVIRYLSKVEFDPDLIKALMFRH